MPAPETEKLDSGGNRNRADDSTLRKENETAASIAVSTQSVKRQTKTGRFYAAVRDFERGLIVEAVAQMGTLSAAADHFGMDRSTLTHKAHSLGIKWKPTLVARTVAE